MIESSVLLERILQSSTLDRLNKHLQRTGTCWNYIGAAYRGRDRSYGNMVFTFGPERKYIGTHQVMLIGRRKNSYGFRKELGRTSKGTV